MATETLTCAAEGSTTTWTANTGTKVDAVATNNGDTSYISSSTTTGRVQQFALSDPTGINALDTINSVTLYAVARRGGTTNASFILTAVLGASTTDGATKTSTSTYATYSHAFTTKPGGGAWTLSDVNSLVLQIRNTQTRDVRATQLYAVVDYTPAVLLTGEGEAAVTADAESELGLGLGPTGVATAEAVSSAGATLVVNTGDATLWDNGGTTWDNGGTLWDSGGTTLLASAGAAVVATSEATLAQTVELTASTGASASTSATADLAQALSLQGAAGAGTTASAAATTVLPMALVAAASAGAAASTAGTVQSASTTLTLWDNGNTIWDNGGTNWDIPVTAVFFTGVATAGVVPTASGTPTWGITLGTGTAEAVVGAVADAGLQQGISLTAAASVSANASASSGFMGTRFTTWDNGTTIWDNGATAWDGPEAVSFRGSVALAASAVADADLYPISYLLPVYVEDQRAEVIYRGTTPISAIYRGPVLLWEALGVEVSTASAAAAVNVDANASIGLAYTLTGAAAASIGAAFTGGLAQTIELTGAASAGASTSSSASTEASWELTSGAGAAAVVAAAAGTPDTRLEFDGAVALSAKATSFGSARVSVTDIRFTAVASAGVGVSATGAKQIVLPVLLDGVASTAVEATAVGVVALEAPLTSGVAACSVSVSTVGATAITLPVQLTATAPIVVSLSAQGSLSADIGHQLSSGAAALSASASASGTLVAGFPYALTGSARSFVATRATGSSFVWVTPDEGIDRPGASSVTYQYGGTSVSKSHKVESRTHRHRAERAI